MPTATITSKGQITIPKSVRNAFHLRVGDRIDFVISGSEVRMVPISKSVDDVFGILNKPDISPRTVEDMNEAIRTHVQNRMS
uniref:Looped-hinge helix DNA binding domain-containing protein, AbrB family n=1 Tax=Candidatus Kentrum sp. SD TaxID=2126332 RepID=A0A451BS18_9GAMM|nr:MAG: looped-hinge helix DNA binding domain-containing protein, AbrB family [Candidatus Kentron sp. SD]